jgi:hypothetical protein
MNLDLKNITKKYAWNVIALNYILSIQWMVSPPSIVHQQLAKLILIIIY